MVEASEEEMRLAGEVARLTEELDDLSMRLRDADQAEAKVQELTAQLATRDDLAGMRKDNLILQRFPFC